MTMNMFDDKDQFQLLEEKVEQLIGMVSDLKKEKEAIEEKSKIQEEKLMDISAQMERLKVGRDQAKQRIISLLEKIEQIGL
jgi:hypothetical protein